MNLSDEDLNVENLNVVGDVAVNSVANEPAPAVGGPSDWFVRTRDGEQWAGYGPPNSEAVFSVVCDRDGGQLNFNTIAIPRSGAGSTTMRLSATGFDQSLDAEASEEGLPSTTASVPAGAEWLARLIAASGNLTVQVGDSEPVVVPMGDPLTALIRDCGR